MNSLGNDSFLKKELGPVTMMQVIAIAIAIVIGLALLWVEDLGNSLLAWVIIAIILYMVPHLAGAKPQTKAVYGAVFIIAAMLFGAFGIGSGYIDDHSQDEFDESGATFYHVTYDADNGEVKITADFDDSSRADGAVPAVSYCKVDKIPFRSVLLTKVTDNMSIEKMNVTGEGTSSAEATATISINESKLYFIFVSMVTIDDDGSHSVIGSTKSATTLSGWDFTGSDSDYCIGGCAYALLYIGTIFYLVLIFTTLMRRKFASTRKKMESQGRLYPQGYGRCTFCGAIVLPGEVNCRKCGAYIDRPESMKPHKKDILRCSACGAEISEDMTECPKCGAKFDGEENIVTHEDGTKDVSDRSIACPVCGKHIPANSERCTYCGKKFNE